MYHGYSGKIVRLNLNDRSVSVEDLDLTFAQKFLGGLGFNVKILFDEVGPDIFPLNPENIVLFTPGTLTGTAAPTSPRIEVTTKSPLTNLIGTGNAGGHWGPNLKKAGYDSVIVKGSSQKPVYIIIDDQNISFKEGSSLWGLDAWETTDVLTGELGKDYSIMALGPAGENLVRFAAPVFDKQHMPGRSHTGAVLGSKKLKAIAVRGTKELSISDPIAFKEVVEKTEKRIIKYPGWPSRVRAGSMGCFGKGREGIDYEDLADRLTIRGPPGIYCPCMMEPLYGCNLVTNIKEGKYANTEITCAGLTLYSGVAEQFQISLEAAYKINELSQRYGMDMFGSVYFAYEIYKRGLITKDYTGGLELKLGSEEPILTLLKMIAYREGIGNILSEGAVRAAKAIGKGSERFVAAVKGLETMRMDPRVGLRDNLFTVLSILTNPRGGDDLKGTHGLSNYPRFPCWAERIGWSKEKYLNWLLEWLDIPLEVKKEIFGEPPSLEDVDEVLITKWYNELTSVYNSLGICMFSGTVTDAVGPTSQAKLYSAATGFYVTPIELMETGERIFNLMRIYNVRNGLSRKNDHWPESFYEESSIFEPEKAPPFDKLRIDQALDRYYELRGWDKTTGSPKPETLKRLKLDNF